VVSDGTGRTAEQGLNAALTQFPGVKVQITRRARVRSEKKVLGVIEEAAKAGGIIVHTLVADALRASMTRLGRQYNVETIDVMGPLLARLSQQFSITPSEKPGLFGEINKTYFRRIETMEYAFHHDDGMRIHELRTAEIVLLGVSRTFKTPLSIYLAFKGWFVANVPIVLGNELPSTLLPAGRVFCLDINARQLTEMRRVRSNYLKRELGGYADFDFVRTELMFARNIFKQHPEWPVVNVGGKPIEEIASEILALNVGGLPSRETTRPRQKPIA
jgi:hypothetical protein